MINNKRTISIYRSNKNIFDQKDLNELAKALSDHFGQGTIKIISDPQEDGEEIIFILEE